MKRAVFVLVAIAACATGACSSMIGGSPADRAAANAGVDGGSHTATDAGLDATVNLPVPDASRTDAGADTRAGAGGVGGGAGGAGRGGANGGAGGAGGGAGAYTGILAQLSSKTMFWSNPTAAATWLVNPDTGMTQSQIDADMNAAGNNRFPVFTFYRYFLGSGTNAAAYQGWATAAAMAIGRHPSQYAVVVLEPDSFALQNQPDVNQVLDAAIATIKQQAPNAALFLDIGHSAWLASDTVVQRAKSFRNYALIDGWASNTSNFQPTSNEENYARQLYGASGKPAIVDTSRNGLGTIPSTIINPPANEWAVGASFAFHPSDPAFYFNYHNKPSDERD
jgi:hypothetical protein